MTEHTDHELQPHSDNSPQQWAQPQEAMELSQEEDSVNPISMFMDRMHGRWLWALLVGIVLSPIFAIVAWNVAPIKYTAQGRIEFREVLPALIGSTIETSRQGVEMEAHRSAVVSDKVFSESLEDPELKKYIDPDNPKDIIIKILSGRTVSVPKRSNLVKVYWEGEDKDLAAAIVASTLRAYRKLYAPAPEIQFAERQRKLLELAKIAEAKIDDIDQQRRVLFENNPYGVLKVEPIIEENTTRLRALEIERLEHERHMTTIMDQARLEGRQPDPNNPNDRILPTEEDLDLMEPLYASTRSQFQVLKSRMQSLVNRFGQDHMSLRRVKSQFEAMKQQLDGLKVSATNSWNEGPGKGLVYGLLEKQLLLVTDEIEHIRKINAQLSEQKFDDDKLSDRLARLKNEQNNIELRLTQLANEEDTVKEGRIIVWDKDVTAPLAPSSDRRVMMAAAGAIGGFLISFLCFFLLGSVDKKTYGVRQLADSSSHMRTLGVMPNMDEVDESPDTVNLATDCVHRIRSRIESRRSPERGYALMISSPYQGDGKTTLAVSLGWSYAESGYRTVIVDADFIGRSMTHQFGRLREPGLREIVRSGKLNGEVVELGHPNLNLLGVGFDRRVSAANLNPGVLRRVIEGLREQFDLIIVDTGPMTASIEALPVASVSDGVVLALRRGRSRSRIEECIKDIRTVGADYLGIVLNYADQSDCMRYGSTSRTSMEVITALEAGSPDPNQSDDRHPLLGRQDLDDHHDGTDKG